MRNACFILVSIFSFPLFATTCHQGSAGSLNLYQKEEAVEKRSLEADLLKGPKMNIYRVKNNDSCGLQGCDFALFVPDQKGCLKNAFSSYGSKILKVENEWSGFTLATKSLGIDGGKTIERKYFYNAKNFKYEEKRIE